jgi:hypothetical protein
LRVPIVYCDASDGPKPSTAGLPAWHDSCDFH